MQSRMTSIREWSIEDLEESSIPYDVDLVDLRHADPALIEEIRRDGVKWPD